jgi:hypothetical protein
LDNKKEKDIESARRIATVVRECIGDCGGLKVIKIEKYRLGWSLLNYQTFSGKLWDLFKSKILQRKNENISCHFCRFFKPDFKFARLYVVFWETALKLRYFFKLVNLNLRQNNIVQGTLQKCIYIC